MADDNKASYAKIGFTVFIGAIATVVALVYLGGLRGKGNVVYGETYFDKSVSGLAVGSPVNFRGVKIGTISSIDFVGDEYDVPVQYRHLICVRMAMPCDNLGFDACPNNPFEGDAQKAIDTMSLRATISSSGITGLSRIEIDIQTNVPPRVIAWKPKCLYIPPAVSLMENFSDAATKVMNQINKMDIAAVWSNINASVQSLAKMTEGAQAVLESRRGDVDKLAGDITETISSIRGLSSELKDNPSLIIRERIPTPLPETKR